MKHNARELPYQGVWSSGAERPLSSPDELISGVARVREPVHILRLGARGSLAVAYGGEIATRPPGASEWGWLATLPPLYPEWLGDRSFTDVHGVRFPYIAGAMANGIATTDLVVAMARAQMLGFFGAAGLPPDHIEQALDRIAAAVPDPHSSWGANLIHSPQEPHLEEATVGLYVRRGVRRVSASAYMKLTPSVVRYALSGIAMAPDGHIQRRHHVFAKISRPEVARHFMSPPPADMVRSLVDQGLLTAEEGRLGAFVPVAEDIIVESDSGGHTDNQPLGALFPTIIALRDEIAANQRYTRPIRVGAAGGMGTPQAVAAGFALGAAFVLTGSINQAAIESGLSWTGKQMLAGAGMADVVMAPAADMFELGVKVQVLKRGTMFGVRAQRLYDLYTSCASLADIPRAQRVRLEKELFQSDLDTVWQQTCQFFQRRDPRQIERAQQDPRHKMALVFRWYLGQSSRWAIDGLPERQLDYQIWCGPAMGAFNTWTRDSFLADPEQRTAVQMALNLLEGASVITRAHQLRTYGVPVPTRAFAFRPRPMSL